MLLCLSPTFVTDSTHLHSFLCPSCACPVPLIPVLPTAAINTQQAIRAAEASGANPWATRGAANVGEH
jgi:hypothetical protein